VRIGLALPIAEDDGGGTVIPYASIREMALTAEAAGLDSIWVYDHLLFRFDGETSGLYEAWTMLTALAEATSRVHLGVLVLCTEFRNPALLAKMAGTLDAISDGRLILGIGSGWHDPEYVAFGYPTDHKVGRFEDSVTIIHSLIRSGRSDHRGRFHSVEDAVLVPPARPDIPILIAAKRPRMMDLTARYADAWNLAWFGAPDDRLTVARADLEAACERVGRDPATLEITVGIEIRYDEFPSSSGEEGSLAKTPLSGETDAVVAGLRAHDAFGADHLVVVLDPTTPETIARFIESVDRFRDHSIRVAQGD
jgi:alkanesulfonate monooxygenase SsuD/methylene tetrahydromethanopterin reductase-like flavin-dependent oxidoreductase (luciferase family)